MNEKKIKELENYAEMYIINKKNNNENVHEYEIKSIVNSFLPIVSNISENEIEQVIKNLESRFKIQMDNGTVLKDLDTYKSWYFDSLSKRKTDYWDRYRSYLIKDIELPFHVVDEIDRSAEIIMDNLGDPLGESNFKRKGLVIGSVQSGKTSNYIALMNKAADSGYKTIIILTGTIEKLRQQTQSRIDEGFVGLDSRAFSKDKREVSIGVGKIEKLAVSPMTATDEDFNLTLPRSLETESGPVVLVLKKNKAVLNKLYKWLNTYSINENTNKIESPLLIIDDEADNASINTAKLDDLPTVINQKIRDIINLFSKSSYVGFTATPFANIFIDPQLDENDNDDLFPRDFIYLLEQPSNYIGPNSMYDKDGKHFYMIRNNDDLENILPLKHKKNEYPSKLPESLENSIITFFLANAVRDLRGNKKNHRSMLVHFSRFINIQNYSLDLVDSFVKLLKREIQNYILMDNETELIKRIHDIYDLEYGEEKNNFDKIIINEKWDEIKKVLYSSIAPIQVKVINSGNASKGLNYDDYENGLRLIAIGGLSLARGLTLEGLMTSYFYRNTKMYDTLMQMGRWFGYRDGYADLCRLWISNESAEWYGHIAVATESLKYEIKKMEGQNKKPIEFGLRVRSFEETPLIITARNKMRTAELINMKRSLNGQTTETPIIHAKKHYNSTNNAIIEEWLLKNKEDFLFDKKELHLERNTLKNVPKEKIVDLLNNVEFPYLNDITEIVKTIQKSNDKILDKWDVFVATNKLNNSEYNIIYGGIEISPQKRSFGFFGEKNEYIRMSDKNRRLGQTNFATAGLTKKQYKKIEPEINKQRKALGKNKRGVLKAASENMYFSTGINRNPLLVIYPIQLKESKDENINNFIKNNNSLFVGISIGIPEIDGEKTIVYNYAINVVAQQQLNDFEKDYEPEDEDIEETRL